jgi:hypothetical protein
MHVVFLIFTSGVNTITNSISNCLQTAERQSVCLLDNYNTCFLGAGDLFFVKLC